MSLNSQVVDHDGYRTAYLSAGTSGRPVVLVHGSGPGVSARANWQGTLQSRLAANRRLFAPDIVGFGGTIHVDGGVADHDQRLTQLESFVRALDVGAVDVVGNSMGGALALGLAVRAPELVRSLILMGTTGCEMTVSPGLEKVWGYIPSLEAMAELMDVFAFDSARITPELIQLRYEASIAAGVQERYAASFGPPFQARADAMALSDDTLTTIVVPTLMLHGAEDAVIPLVDTSLRLVRLLPNAQLVVFSRCGHWTQIERADDFVDHVARFLERIDEDQTVALSQSASVEHRDNHNTRERATIGGMPVLKVLPDTEVTARPEESVLACLYRSGYSYRVGCRRGGCGICKADLLAGAVTYPTTVSFDVLSADERDTGTCLTCRAVPVGDVTIALRGHDLARTFSGTFRTANNIDNCNEGEQI